MENHLSRLLISEFLLNCIEYLVNNPAIRETRNKDIVLRLLDSQKVNEVKNHLAIHQYRFTGSFGYIIWFYISANPEKEICCLKIAI